MAWSTSMASTRTSPCCTRRHSATLSTPSREPTSSRSPWPGRELASIDAAPRRARRGPPGARPNARPAAFSGERDRRGRHHLRGRRRRARHRGDAARPGRCARGSPSAEARDALAGPEASLEQGGLGASDLLGRAVLQLSAYEVLADLAAPLRGAQADVEDVVRELRLRDERLEEDPERLQARAATDSAVLGAASQVRPDPRRGPRLRAGQPGPAGGAGGDRGDPRRAAGRRLAVAAELGAAEERLGAVRREAAPRLASAVEAHLQELALSGARLEVRVGDDPAGSEVEFLLGANPGEPALPLSKVASGGELARAMLGHPAGAVGGPAHAGLRRGRCRSRRGGGPRRRVAPFALSGATTRCWS